MVDYDSEVDRFCTTFFAIPYQALLFFILILPVEEQQDYLKRCTKSVNCIVVVHHFARKFDRNTIAFKIQNLT